MEGFCPLASGSKGNALYFGTEKTRILIDAGISVLQLRKRLERVCRQLEEIDAIVITHEHIDHIRALPLLCRKAKIPIFANLATAQALSTLDPMIAPYLKVFSNHEPFVFRDLHILPFSIQHDASDPVGFRIDVESGWSVGVCADLGRLTTPILEILKGVCCLYLESNHQVSMVHACNRSQTYKQRVLSHLGHLSNDQCAQALKELIHSQLQQIYLAHLSSECNHPKLALEIAREAVGPEMSSLVTVALQEEVSLFTKIEQTFVF